MKIRTFISGIVFFCLAVFGIVVLSIDQAEAPFLGFYYGAWILQCIIGFVLFANHKDLGIQNED